jgi:hypothetical protein
VVGPLAAEVLDGETAQFVVDERHQPVERGAVSAAPFLQKLGDTFGRLHQAIPTTLCWKQDSRDTYSGGLTVAGSGRGRY